MLMNWPERVWIYSPLRPLFLKRHAIKWRRLVQPERTGVALEIGCGLGHGPAVIQHYLGYGRVFAFDLEEVLARRAARRGGNGVAFCVADAQDFPFSNASFDAVINYGVIHHVIDWRRCLKEIGRVLRPRGVFYFEEIYPPLYANFLLKRMLRHPREDRFDGPLFIRTLESEGLRLVPNVNCASRYGIVGAAIKDSFSN
jgi:SAM-dependent methyltransferase